MGKVYPDNGIYEFKILEMELFFVMKRPGCGHECRKPKCMERLLELS